MTRTSEPPLAHFEERILTELKQMVARQPGPRPARVRSPRPRRFAVGAAVGASAAVAAGLLVATATAPAGTRTVSYSLAVDFLNHAAAAARTQNAPLPRPGQVVYSVQLISSPGARGVFRQCEDTWYLAPLTGGAFLVAGRKCGPDVPLPAPHAASPPPNPGMYPALNTLPTSPAALRAALYAAAARGAAAWGLPSSYSADQIVAWMIRNLVQVPLSGSLRAALYQVIAGIPGVTLIRNADDAAGRHGTGIVMRWSFPGYGMGAMEIIFAPRTYAMLGLKDTMPGQQVEVAILSSELVTPSGS